MWNQVLFLTANSLVLWPNGDHVKHNLSKCPWLIIISFFGSRNKDLFFSTPLSIALNSFTLSWLSSFAIEVAFNLGNCVSSSGGFSLFSLKFFFISVSIICLLCRVLNTTTTSVFSSARSWYSWNKKETMKGGEYSRISDDFLSGQW